MSKLKEFFKKLGKLIERIRDWVITNPLLVALLDWAKTHSLPGFFKVPIYDVVVFVIREAQRFSLSIRANSIAFSFFISLFPAILALFTLVPYFSNIIYSFLPGEEDYVTLLVAEINQIIPGVDVSITDQRELEESVEENIFTQTLRDIIDRPRYGLLSLGFFLALYFASNGMIAMMQGFEKSYDRTFKKRSNFRKRGIAIGLTFLLGFLLVASVLLIILGNIIINWLDAYINFDSFVHTSLSILRWTVFILLFYTGISMIYRYGAPTKRRFSFFSPGTTLAASLSILSSLLFSFYVENFSQYNRLYGSIGTVIILLLWLQINAFTLLIGFELNASIAVNRDLKEIKDEED